MGMELLGTNVWSCKVGRKEGGDEGKRGWSAGGLKVCPFEIKIKQVGGENNRSQGAWIGSEW
jgi:hypothetical protein